MIECFEVKKSSDHVDDRVSLDFEQRQKSRGRAKSENGEEIAWFLPRAHVLADGDCLLTMEGKLIQVVAAPETLSEVQCDDTLALTKAAYHLGNRHVPLQIDNNTLSYQHDHVLDDMVTGLGLCVRCVQKPFHPEAGAYHSHGHKHGHNHSHEHAHPHKHEH